MLSLWRFAAVTKIKILFWACKSVGRFNKLDDKVARGGVGFLIVNA